MHCLHDSAAMFLLLSAMFACPHVVTDEPLEGAAEERYLNLALKKRVVV
jgi:hypothetical protein